MTDERENDRELAIVPMTTREGAGGDLSRRLQRYAVEASERLDEVRRLYRRMLDEAEKVAQLNEQAFLNVKTIRHRVIEARTLSELTETLVRELKRLHVHRVFLVLDQSQTQPAALLVDSLPAEFKGSVVLPSREALLDQFGGEGGISPRIGEKERVDRLGLFADPIRSAVMLPLEFRGALIGCLALGSRSGARFASDRSTDLLEDLAVTTALCLDNVLTHEQNERLASTDALTGVFNRRFFFESGARIFNLSQRHGDSLTCLFIDLDDFKPINDRYGHDAGDLALKRLARYIQARMRRTDVFARLGGDEFALLLPRTSPSEAALLVDTLLQGLGEISFSDIGLDEMKLQASIGQASLQPADHSLEDLLNRADQAMYDTKAHKR